MPRTVRAVADPEEIPAPEPAPMAERDPLRSAAGWTVLAGAFLLPLFLSPAGMNTFRLPKELLLIAEAIVLLAIGAMRLVWSSPRRPRRDPIVIGVLAIAAWTLVSAALSTNRAVSAQTVIWVLSACVVFLATYLVAPHLRMHFAAAALLVPAILNTIVFFLQKSNIYNPLYFGEAAERFGRFAETGLVGGPGDLGMYFVAPLIFAAWLAQADRGWRRWLFALTAVVLFAALVATGNVTGTGAGAIGVLLVFAPRKPAKAIGAVVAMAILLIIVASAYTPLRTRLGSITTAFREQRYDDLTAYRLMPFLSAVQMFRDHPLTGVGPGCYRFQYLPYRLRVDQQFGRYLTPRGNNEVDLVRTTNYAQTHNDHLQVLAETGLPGYALLLAALVLLARTRSRLAIAVAGGFFVLALAQFPLSLAAPLHAFVTVAALGAGWSRES